jgi:hypothetical protein
VHFFGFIIKKCVTMHGHSNVKCFSFVQNFCIPVSYLTTLAFTVVLYGCETWSVTLMENIDWGCFRTGCWGWCLDLRDGEVQNPVETSVMRNFMAYALRQLLLRWSIEWTGTRWTGRVASNEVKKYTSTILVWEPEGWNFLEDLVVDRKIMFKMYVKDDRTACAGLISLRK